MYHYSGAIFMQWDDDELLALKALGSHLLENTPFVRKFSNSKMMVWQSIIYGRQSQLLSDEVLFLWFIV